LIWISDRAGLRMVGERMLVLLSGDAGIGKSRLTAELLERLAAEPHTRLRYLCSPQHTDSALYPVIGQIERSSRNDSPQAKLDKLDAVLAQTSTSTQDAALLPRCCRSQTMDAIPRSIWPRSSAGKERWKP
jgi:predicted ATPase